MALAGRLNRYPSHNGTARGLSTRTSRSIPEVLVMPMADRSMGASPRTQACIEPEPTALCPDAQRAIPSARRSMSLLQSN